MESYFPREDSPEKMLSPAARLFQSPRFNCYIIAIMGCKTRIDPEIIKQGLSQTLLKHPRFSSKLEREKGFLRRKKWVRTTVTLNDHVFAPKLESNENDNEDNNETLVQNYVSNMTTRHLDRSKPLWEVHLLNVRTRDSESTAVFRLHHSLGDGASLMSLLFACTRRTADPQSLPTLPTLAPSRRARQWWFPSRVARQVWNTVAGVTVFVGTMLFLKDTKSPIKGPRGVEAVTKRFVHRTIALSDVKFVKNAMKATINDVLLGVTQAALSRYLNRRYGEEEKNKGKNKKNYLPKRIRLNSTILVNLRPAVGIQDLANMMAKNSKVKWGNILGYLLLPFEIALHEDPLEYVRRAKIVVDRKKNSFEALCTYFCNQILVKLLGVEVSAALARRAVSNTTVAFSNIAGPVEEVGFYGHEITYLAPTVYGHPHALTIHFQSYAEKLTIVLAVDPNVIPDHQQLFDDFEVSLELIKEAVVKHDLKLVNNTEAV